MALGNSAVENVPDRERHGWSPELRNGVDDKSLFGNSDKMKAIKTTIDQISDTDVPVLIVGESGTGKGLVADAVHLHSLRRDKPLIRVNCVAIPGELLESELFGYEKGAFTGAYNSKPGRFEFAHGGTLILDEIGDMPFSLQGKLMRVLQEGRFFRLGGSKEVEIDIRIIASTNQDLENGIKEGAFREDLFYRLNVIRIRIPPLRERKEEICPLIDDFVGKYSRIYNKSSGKMSDNALKLLTDYSWPGNVRELENIIKKYVVLESEETILRGLNIYEAGTEEGESDPAEEELHPDWHEGDSLKEIGKRAAAHAEKIAIVKTLEQTYWNRRRAAEILKVSYKTLLNKIKENGLDRV